MTYASRVSTGLRRAAWDRRNMAMHEAGHAALCEHHGIACSPSLWFDGSKWRGELHVPLQSIAPQKAREIAVAGAAALGMWHGIPLTAAFAKQAMSESDWALFGDWREPLERDLDRAGAILVQRWQRVNELARGLIGAAQARGGGGSFLIGRSSEWVPPRFDTGLML